MKSSDDWIDHWKKNRHAEVPEPEPGDDFADRLMERLEPDKVPVPVPPISPLMFFARAALVAFAAILMAGRLVATLALFFTSTSLQ